MAMPRIIDEKGSDVDGENGIGVSVWSADCDADVTMKKHGS